MLIHLYSEPRAKLVNHDALAGYLRENLPFARVDIRPPLVEGYVERASGDLDRIAEAFAQAKVRNPSRPRAAAGRFEPLWGEVDFERQRISDPEKGAFGLLYDGLGLVRLFATLIPEEETGLEHLNIVFTNQLIGTWEDSDRRYHARVGVFSFPSIISTTGVVEAPAKPREYYLMRQRYAALGMEESAEIEFRKAYAGAFIDHYDLRMTDVLKGYIMQAVFFHVGGEGFCADRDCRLFNAHWQSEMINAQLGGKYEFCPHHAETLNEWRERGIEF